MLMSVVKVKVLATKTLPVQTPMGASSVNATLASMAPVSTAQVGLLMSSTIIPPVH